ncbi:MAG: 4-(cytidine 5'-diphospho)-2-C-methyl-D-erythritol kinase [Microbacteriaceae bacterium]
MSARSVTATAPGKINVCMRVGPLREDGYHDVATVYQAVSLLEEISATEADNISVSFSGPIDTSGIALGESNLVVRAARAVAAEAGITAGAAIHVVKHVPVAGGMGGGSADAAATLVAVDALWETNLGAKTLHRLAADLGADVPFALHGGTAIGLGRGDVLSPVLATGHFEWVLVTCDEGLSTPEVFMQLDRHRSEHSVDIETVPVDPEVKPELLHALRAGDAISLAEYVRNDLQAAALQLKPELGDVLEFGETHGALAGIVSGSGPTVAFLAADDTAALALVDVFTAERRQAMRVISPVHGARVH